MIAPIINALYLLKIKHKSKITFVLICLFLEYVALSICFQIDDHNTGFYLSVLIAFLVGICQSMGEITCMGFLKGIDDESIGGWASGTGISGVAAGFIVLTLDILVAILGYWVSLQIMTPFRLDKNLTAIFYTSF